MAIRESGGAEAQALAGYAGTAIEGVRLYCCVPIPYCELLARLCGDAGGTYTCADPVVPPSRNPSLICATLFSGGGGSDYCCTHEAACVQADLFGCGDAGESYACTGDADPAQHGLRCGPGAYEDAGTRGTYCREAIGTIVDGGALE